MTASRTNLGRQKQPEPEQPIPLALHECYCQDLTLPHRHQLGDHADFTQPAVAAAGGAR